MQYTIIVRSHDKKDNSSIRAIIFKQLRLKLKKEGLDQFESRLDIHCLDIAMGLGFNYSRTLQELTFTDQIAESYGFL